MTTTNPLQSVPLTGRVLSHTVTPADVLAVVQEIVALGREWVKVHEEETTRRAEIAADRDTLLADIHARRDLFVTYLDNSFDERTSNFEALFARLDVALANDSDAAATILSSITALAMKSPFADLRDPDLLRKKFGDDGAEWPV